MMMMIVMMMRAMMMMTSNINLETIYKLFYMYKPFPFYFPISPFPLFFKTILFQVFLFINLQTLLKKGKKGKWGNKGK